jgi:hypothetical protein
MATKRMLSSKIVDSDAFLDMPQTSQLLYFHLSMRTDDDGFVGNPRKIMRMIGSAENDITILFTKKFILGFESGIIVIKHHRINNNWDSHNCKRTQYVEEFNMLRIKENGSYTLDNTQGLLAQTEIRLKSDEKKSLEENRIEENKREKKRIHIVAKATEQPLEVKEFNNKESVSNLLKDESRDIKILGYYFMRKGIVFSSQKELSQAIAVNRNMINAFTKKNKVHPFEGIPSEKILKAMDYAKEKFPDWSLKVIMERCYEIGK